MRLSSTIAAGAVIPIALGDLGSWDINKDPIIREELAQMEKGAHMKDPRPYSNSGYFAEANCDGGRDVEFETRAQLLPGFEALATTVKQDSLWEIVNHGHKDATHTITTSRINVTRNTSSWTVGAKETTGGTDPETGVSDSIEVSASYSKLWEQDVTYSVTTTDTLVCEANYACLFTPVTYQLRLTGICDQLPMTTWGYPYADHGWMDACTSPDYSCSQKREYTRRNCPPQKKQCSLVVPVFDNDKPRVTILKLIQKLNSFDDVQLSTINAQVE